MKRVTIEVSDENIQPLKRYAKQRGLTLNAVVYKAVLECIERLRGKPQKELREVYRKFVEEERRRAKHV